MTAHASGALLGRDYDSLSAIADENEEPRDHGTTSPAGSGDALPPDGSSYDVIMSGFDRNARRVGALGAVPGTADDADVGPAGPRSLATEIAPDRDRASELAQRRHTATLELRRRQVGVKPEALQERDDGGDEIGNGDNAAANGGGAGGGGGDNVAPAAPAAVGMPLQRSSEWKEHPIADQNLRRWLNSESTRSLVVWATEEQRNNPVNHHKKTGAKPFAVVQDASRLLPPDGGRYVDVGLKWDGVRCVTNFRASAKFFGISVHTVGRGADSVKYLCHPFFSKDDARVICNKRNKTSQGAAATGVAVGAGGAGAGGAGAGAGGGVASGSVAVAPAVTAVPAAAAATATVTATMMIATATATVMTTPARPVAHAAHAEPNAPAKASHRPRHLSLKRQRVEDGDEGRQRDAAARLAALRSDSPDIGGAGVPAGPIFGRIFTSSIALSAPAPAALVGEASPGIAWSPLAHQGFAGGAADAAAGASAPSTLPQPTWLPATPTASPSPAGLGEDTAAGRFGLAAESLMAGGLNDVELQGLSHVSSLGSDLPSSWL